MNCFLRHIMLRSEGWSEKDQKPGKYLDILLGPELTVHLKMDVSVSVSVQHWSEKTMQVIDCKSRGANSIVRF